MSDPIIFYKIRTKIFLYSRDKILLNDRKNYITGGQNYVKERRKNEHVKKIRKRI